MIFYLAVWTVLCLACALLSGGSTARTPWNPRPLVSAFGGAGILWCIGLVLYEVATWIW